MKLNLDMAKKRLDYHLNLENRKSQSVLRHLSLPRNTKPPASIEGTTRASRREDRKSYYAGKLDNTRPSAVRHINPGIQTQWGEAL